jgi:hypothetical protein
MLRMVDATKQFPSSLFVSGIDIGATRDPTRTGGMADVYKGVHRGAFVALKRLRTDNSDDSNLFTVSCFAFLAWDLD